MKRIGREFFERDVLECAREMVGLRLVAGECAGVVVETEAYREIGDEACHTFTRPSAREFVERHEAGTAYVYFNYGVHWMFNVLVKPPGGVKGFVLVRALEPVAGLELMRKRRGRERAEDLCSGPGKLAQAMGFSREHHGQDVCDVRSEIYFVGEDRVREVVSDVRIGISVAQELEWRFLEKNSRWVSKGIVGVKEQTPVRRRKEGVLGGRPGRLRISPVSK